MTSFPPDKEQRESLVKFFEGYEGSSLRLTNQERDCILAALRPSLAAPMLDEADRLVSIAKVLSHDGWPNHSAELIAIAEKLREAPLSPLAAPSRTAILEEAAAAAGKKSDDPKDYTDQVEDFDYWRGYAQGRGDAATEIRTISARSTRATNNAADSTGRSSNGSAPKGEVADVTGTVPAAPSSTAPVTAEDVITALRELADNYAYIHGVKTELSVGGRTRRESIIAQELARLSTLAVSATGERQ